MPRALIIGAGPEALLGIEPCSGLQPLPRRLPRTRLDAVYRNSSAPARSDRALFRAGRRRSVPGDADAAARSGHAPPADPHLRQRRGLRYNLERMASDKRDSERVEFLGALHGEVMVFQPSAIRQMSHGGMQVETSFPLQLDSLHDFRLTLGDRSVVVKGRIAHSRISDVDQDIITYRTGVEFIEPSERVAAAIAAFRGRARQAESRQRPSASSPSADR